jgi:thiamine-phosphate pyrophosphorylase
LAEADRAGLDAVLVSSLFPSRSASAGAPLGPDAFAAWVGAVQTPVIALGGVNAANAHLLIGSGAAGLAAVEAWLA